MVSMTVYMKIIPEKETEFLQTMTSLKQDEQHSRGLLSTTIYRSIDDQNLFSFTNQWETDDDLKNYLKGKSFTVLLGAVEVLCESTEIKYTESAS
jgi:quinol monooxygenase YgiN